MNWAGDLSESIAHAGVALTSSSTGTGSALDSGASSVDIVDKVETVDKVDSCAAGVAVLGRRAAAAVADTSDGASGYVNKNRVTRSRAAMLAGDDATRVSTCCTGGCRHSS